MYLEAVAVSAVPVACAPMRVHAHEFAEQSATVRSITVYICHTALAVVAAAHNSSRGKEKFRICSCKISALQGHAARKGRDIVSLWHRKFHCRTDTSFYMELMHKEH